MTGLTIGDVVVRVENGEVSFSRRDQATPLIQLDADDVGKLIEFLSDYARSELTQRSSFLVPVSPASGLTVTLKRGQTAYSVTPRNISVMGIFVEFSSADVSDLPRDAVLEITLAFEERTVSLRGVVNRREANGYGIVFPESIRQEELDPPLPLVEIVMELQRRMIAVE